MSQAVLPVVLLVDDDCETLLSHSRALSSFKVDARVEVAATSQKAMDLFDALLPSVVVLDLSLNRTQGPESGFELLRHFIAAQGRRVRVIVLTGHAGNEYGIKALQLGASSFIAKPADLNHLMAVITDALAQARLYRELETLRTEPASQSIVGVSSLIEKVREQVRYASSNNQAVLILGETGTGKGLCAQSIHALSARSKGRFVRFQPSFTSVDLVNSDLYGHTKGAFTGASETRKGLLVDAHNGSLFLDEIDELPLETQVGLLGVLQTKSFRVLGSNKEEHSDFRLICASNGDLEQKMKEGLFRNDLFHRINHLRIYLPPLRDRPEDILPIAISVLKRVVDREALNVFDIEYDAVRKLEAYPWPGNIRELEACIEGATYRAQYHQRSVVLEGDISIGENLCNKSDSHINFSEKVEAYKLSLIEQALSECMGNQAKAAQTLGLDRSTMRRILARK